MNALRGKWTLMDAFGTLWAKKARSVSYDVSILADAWIARTSNAKSILMDSSYPAPTTTAIFEVQPCGL